MCGGIDVDAAVLQFTFGAERTSDCFAPSSRVRDWSPPCIAAWNEQNRIVVL